MNIRIRLEDLEKKHKLSPGTFVVQLAADGSASYTTPKGEQKTFPTEAAALEYINSKYDDPAIVIIDV